MEDLVKDALDDYINKPPTVKKEEVIYLFQADLNKTPKRYNFDDVNLWSFKQSSITRDEINKANLIIYVCHKNYPRYKILKSRHF